MLRHSLDHLRELAQETPVTLEGAVAQERDLALFLADVQALRHASRPCLPGQRTVPERLKVAHGPTRHLGVLERVNVDLRGLSRDEAGEGRAETVGGVHGEILGVLLALGQECVAQQATVDEQQVFTDFTRMDENLVLGEALRRGVLAESLDLVAWNGGNALDEVRDRLDIAVVHNGVYTLVRREFSTFSARVKIRF
jgi:hypothetical protein